MKRKLPSPTKAEKRRWEIIKTQVGCIASRVMGLGYVPCEIHHMLDTGSTISHSHTFGLTYEKHQGNNGIHKAKKAFREHYGSDEYLLQLTNDMVAEVEAKIIK